MDEIISESFPMAGFGTSSAQLSGLLTRNLASCGYSKYLTKYKEIL